LNSPIKRNIKNIVYVMFENRSFDNLLGWLYDGEKDPPHVVNIPANPEIKFKGLTKDLLSSFSQPLKRKLSFKGPGDYPIVRGVQGNHLPCSTPIADPHETFQYVTQQIYQSPCATVDPTMKGFLQDYYNAHPLLPIHHEILQTYDFHQAPIINTLGCSYGVSDEWFCSIPSQTSINRAYSLIGDSIGYQTCEDAVNKHKTAMVNNHKWGGPFDLNPAPFTGDTIWNVLSCHGHDTDQDWKIYYSDYYLAGYLGHKTSYTYLMFEQLQKLLNPDNSESFTDLRYQNIDCFHQDAKKGRLPRFSYLEPRYTWEEYAGLGIHGNDYHPPSDIGKGEELLRDIYNSLICSPQWDETLLIVAFDEHGGTFDHIAPPTGAIPPEGKHSNECKFDFKRYGVRVPMVFVSPWVTEHSVIRSSDARIPFDHTSWLATLLDWFGLNPALLRDRTACAPMFSDIISDQKRSTVELPDLAECKPELDLKDNELSVGMAEMLSRYLKASNPEADRKHLLKQILTKCETEKEGFQFVRKFRRGKR
jgi:phospholipase C